MTADLDLAVGRTVGAIVKREFAQLDLRQGLPATMIAGFTSDEAAAMVADLVPCRLAGRDDPIEIVVSVNEPHPGIPDHYRLDRLSRTMTWYRNNNTRGLVLIEVDVQGDQQGVVAMHTLTDADVLDPESSERTSRLATITNTAWTVTSRTGLAEPPQALVDALDTVFDALATSRRQSLRQWTAFCLAASRALSKLERAVTKGRGRIRGRARSLSPRSLSRRPTLRAGFRCHAPSRTKRSRSPTAHPSRQRTPGRGACGDDRSVRPERRRWSAL